MDFAAGAEVAVEWSGHAIEQKRANSGGWVTGWRVPPGGTGTVTLGQRPIRKGLLLGQQFVLPFSQLTPAGSSAYAQVVRRTQPVASLIFIENNTPTKTIPHGHRMAVHPVKGSLTQTTPFKFSPYVGLLPNSNTVFHTQPFFGVQFPIRDYRLGAHFVVPAETDLGATGFVLEVDCTGYGFAAQPRATGIVITTDPQPPLSLFELEIVGWEDESAFLWVKGTMNDGHQLILLSPQESGSGSSVHWYQGTGALVVAQADRELEDSARALATAALPEPTSSETIPALTTANAALAIAAEDVCDDPDGTNWEDCGDGDEVPEPTSPSCETWSEKPLPLVSDCPVAAEGQSKCECNWDPVSEKSCGDPGATYILTTLSSWEVNASVSIEIGAVEVGVGGSYTSESSISTGASQFCPGEHGHGQCARVFSGVCVRARSWCTKVAGWGWVIGEEGGVHPWKFPCFVDYCEETKVLNTTPTYTRICDKTAP